MFVKNESTFANNMNWEDLFSKPSSNSVDGSYCFVGNGRNYSLLKRFQIKFLNNGNGQNKRSA